MPKYCNKRSCDSLYFHIPEECPFNEESPSQPPVTPEVEDRVSSGSEQSPSTASPHSSPCPARGSRASLRLGRQRSSCIGRSVSPSPRRVLFGVSPEPLEPVVISSSPVAMPPPITFGRNPLGSPVPSSSWGSSPSVAPIDLIGTISGRLLSEEISRAFQAPSEYKVIGLSRSSLQTTLDLLELNESFRSTGVGVEAESHGVLGLKLVNSLILRTLEPSSGVDTLVRKTLSSMNFEEVSILPMSCVGQMFIQSLWKLKEPPAYSPPRTSGLPPTFHPSNGIPNWTQKL